MVEHYLYICIGKVSDVGQHQIPCLLVLTFRVRFSLRHVSSLQRSTTIPAGLTTIPAGLTTIPAGLLYLTSKKYS